MKRGYVTVSSRRISFVMTALGAGGVQQSVVPYAAAFRNLGYELQILVHHESPIKHLLLQQGFEPVLIQTYLDGYGPSEEHLKEVGSELKQNRPDIIFAFGNHGFPVVDRLRPSALVVCRSGASRVERILPLRRSSAILVTSEKIKEIAVAGGIEPHKLHVIPNFTIPNKSLKDSLKRTERLTIGGMGRLVAIKGFDLLIKAVAHLTIKGHQIDLIIAGAGPQEIALRQISKQHQVNAKFVGWISENQKSEFLRTLDIFVCPSREEPFGFVFLEAMEFGLPIVTTRTIGAQVVFANHEGAIVGEIEDALSMADNIETLLNDRLLRQTMGASNRFVYEENFSIEAGTKRLAEVMRVVDPIAAPAHPLSLER